MKKSDLVPMEHFVELRDGKIYWFFGEYFIQNKFGIWASWYDEDMKIKSYNDNEEDCDESLEIVRVYRRQYAFPNCLNDMKCYFQDHVKNIRERRIKPIWDRDAESID